MTSDKELDLLKAQMDAATPAPDAARRAENLATAMENFDRAQGSRDAPRQTQDRPKAGFLAGVWTMLTTRSAALTGTTALVAGVLLITNPFATRMTSPGVDLTTEELLSRGAPINVDPQSLGEGEAELLPDLTPAPRGGVEMTSEEFMDVIDESPEAPDPDRDLSELIVADRESEPVINEEMEVGVRSILGMPLEPQPTPQPTAPPPAASEVFMDGNFGTLTLSDTDGTLDRTAVQQPDRESFPEADPNPLQVTLENPVSTFSIDVDTASYALLRSSLNRGELPRPEAVRIEEMVNYFSYDYPAPGADAAAPFEPSFTVFETPWNPDTQLVHIALQGEMPVERPPLNLVFLIDVSGSMDEPAKLPLLIQSFRLMLGELSPDDQVAIVTYAGNTGIALEPTAASDRSAIEAALTSLRAGGSTNGQGGLEAAYRLAGEMTQEGEVSRVILATDGDFNVGLSDPSRLEDFIAEERESGTYLSVLGFGRGNLQDATMQALAQNGNGTAAYIDTLHEAQRVLVDQLSGALFPIADDVKVQIEFNPARVAEYRLIGYETRALAREDFNNDAVDAGELGAGHRVTAIYEITPVGSPAIRTDPLRYGAAEALPSQAAELDAEIGFLRLRWKEPGEDRSQLMDFPVTETGAPEADVLFATAVAGFGQLLQRSDFLGDWDYADAIALANANRGDDPFGLRSEAVQLMRLADSLSAN